MDIMIQAGIEKKSFELPYNGGQIWCEHLDGMGKFETEVIRKFTKDKSSFSRPSVSSLMIINLDRTDITENIAGTIVTNILEIDKVFKKIAFVGVNIRWRKAFGDLKRKGISIKFLSDYEKAKEWMF